MIRLNKPLLEELLRKFATLFFLYYLLIIIYTYYLLIITRKDQRTDYKTRPINITSQACLVMESILEEEILDTLETKLIN